MQVLSRKILSHTKSFNRNNCENNTISVWNNGTSLPVEEIHVPTLIFGPLLTSSNYDDEGERVTSGRDRYGAKLCNIFSNRFTVETASNKCKKKFKQTWENNMGKASEPSIEEFCGEDFTKVTFSPDLAKFQMKTLDADIVALMSRRAYDVAATSRDVDVYLNGTRVPVQNLKNYVDLFVRDDDVDDFSMPPEIAYEACEQNEAWEVAVTLSNNGFQQISFVNGIATTKGGRHVEHVTGLIVNNLMETLKKMNVGGTEIKPFEIKNNLWIFVNCLISNPTFDSQTRQRLLQPKNFCSKCTITDEHDTVTRPQLFSIANSLLEKMKTQSNKKKFSTIPELEDANCAGTDMSMECTIILTEGDSGMCMVVSGIDSIGRDKYGIFPLKNKILNVREATHELMLADTQLNNLVQILGLQYNMKYETTEDLKTLRYGKMMIMTDQDEEGAHIKGLLINFIHHNWPSLIKFNFIEQFITPMVKAINGDLCKSFYSLPEFEAWKKETTNLHTYRIKYYKGLGSCSANEAKEYFENMIHFRIRFDYAGDEDDRSIILAFSEKCVEERRVWLKNHMFEARRRKEIGLGEKYLYRDNTKAVTYSDFVNVELVRFFNYDNVRSIPNMIDGLKPAQRKVLHTCLKRNDKREVRVIKLACSVAERTAYRDDETSLMSTIIKLAQNFVGSNNINLLQPVGQFGSRLLGGEDAASPEYIFTKLSPLVRFIFHQDDDALLKYEYFDDEKIEPVYYLPIIPMILVNGADGIGSGWTTKIPNYNPRDIIENLYRMIDGGEPRPMKPYYKNFIGTIESCEDYRYIVSGKISVIGPNEVEITELPVGTWIQTYKETVLEPMLHGTKKNPAIITDYEDFSSDTAVRCIVKMRPEKLNELKKEGLQKAFKLQNTISITSMCAFDENLCLEKYDNVTEIMRDFFKVRMDGYAKRKAYLESILKAEVAKLSNQVRFIREKCNGDLVVENEKETDMIAELVRREYATDPVIAWERQNREETLVEEATNNAEKYATSKNYDYLLGMTIWSLTKERKDELVNQWEDKTKDLQLLQARTPASLWKMDLDDLLAELNKVEELTKYSIIACNSVQ